MSNDFRQVREYQDFMRKSGAEIADLGEEEVAYVMRPKILPFISTSVVLRARNPSTVSAADKLARESRSIYVAMAPRVEYGSEEAEVWEAELDKHGFKLASFGLAPTKTLVLDLEMPEDDILAQMKSKTRYNVRLSGRRGVTTKIIDGEALHADSKYMAEFYMVYIENCKRIQRQCESREQLEEMFEPFKSNSFFVHAYDDEGEVLSVASYLIAGDTVFYQMNGSTDKGRKDFAPNLIVWESILEGKRRGLKKFDFDGIYDDRYEKAQADWKGFSRFKQSFGGQEIKYLGAYMKWFPFLKKRVDASS
jgi:lipid II:glycine glycyltransferase (peptidoglycan interpeptide bridge formation enzyme)